MALDLKNLQGVLRTGQRIEIEGSDDCVIMTPVCRASFVQITEPKEFRGGKPRYGINLIFERLPGAEGHVDVTAVLVPQIIATAQAAGLPIMQTDKDIRFGAKESKTINLGARIKQETGEPFEGYSPSSLWIAAYRQADSGPPECVDEGNRPIAPSVIKSGDWVRVVINPYKPKDWSMLSVGFSTIQRVAQGPAFAGDSVPNPFAPIPGAPTGAGSAVPGAGVDFSKLGM